MVFFTGITIAMMMYFWQQGALLYALFVSLLVEFLNLYIVKSLMGSIEAKMKKRYAEPLQKLKKELRIAKAKEGEFRKSDQKQRDEIEALKEKVRELQIVMDVYKKKTEEQEEQLNRFQNLPSRSKR